MSTERREREWESRLIAVLDSHDTGALAQLLEEMHAADLATFFPELEQAQQAIVLEALSDEQAATLLDELDQEDRARVLDLLSVDRASDILDEMPSDEAADLLAELSSEEADALLERMEPELADDVADLLRYSEDIAGGLMAKEFVRVDPDQTVSEVMTMLRRHHDDAEMIYYLYVLDEDERLLGIVSLRSLIVSDGDTTMAQIMGRNFVSVPTDMPQEDVADLVRRHDLLAVPVLDHEGRMQGIVTVDDIGDVVQEEAAEDLLEISGAEETEETHAPWQQWRGWRSGFLAMLGGLAGAGLVLFFAGVLRDWADVALLLPLLLVLGVTTGSQAALSMDHAYESAVERHRLERIFMREIATGAMLAIVGCVLAGVLFFLLRYHSSAAFFVVLPLGIGLWFASITGALGVVVLRRFGGELGTASHTIIVVIALLVAIGMYLLMAHGVPAPITAH